MLGLTFSSRLDWGSYIISVAKTASKKVGALIRSMKFPSPEVALYLYKSTIRPCMKFCCHVWAGAPFLEPLAHRRNVASLTLFYRCYFGRCSSELAQLVPLPFSRVGLLVILIDYMIFCHHYKDVYVRSFFSWHS